MDQLTSTAYLKAKLFSTKGTKYSFEFAFIIHLENIKESLLSFSQSSRPYRPDRNKMIMKIL